MEEFEVLTSWTPWMLSQERRDIVYLRMDNYPTVFPLIMLSHFVVRNIF